MSDKYQSFEQKASYGVGIQMGNQLLSQPFDGLEAEAVAQGVIDALNKNEQAVPNAEIEKAFQHITQIMQAKQAEDQGSDC